MPFHWTQQLQKPPASMVQRFWTMLQAILSSQVQVIFIPPVHFSILSVQRGTIIQLVPSVMAVGVPTVGVPNPGSPTPGTAVGERSIIIVLDINRTPFNG
jgi:hypothetical protein